MGRVGFEPTIPSMSRRYPSQARPPAQYLRYFDRLDNIISVIPNRIKMKKKDLKNQYENKFI